MSGLHIRKALAADLPALVAMLADDRLGAAREITTLPLAQAYLDAFAAIDADPNQMLMIGEIEGRVVATLQLTFLPGLSRQGMWRGLIEAVRVHQDLRGQRLGEAMMGWAVDACRARGCGLVQLTTDHSRAEAHRFYERLGFEHTHAGYKLML